MKAAFLFLLIFLPGCLTVEKQVETADSEGKRLYRVNCSMCHRLYHPGSYQYPKLEKYLRKYGGNLKPGEYQKLAEYLKTASKKQK